MPKRDFSQAFAPAGERPDMSGDIAAMISAATVSHHGGADGAERWWLPVALIHPDPDQPRGGMDTQDELQALADSLRGAENVDGDYARGQLQPVVVRPDPLHAGDGIHPAEWILVAGERRWRAARKGSIRHVWAARIPDESSVDDIAVLKAQITENEQRADLSDIDIALAAERLHTAGCSISEINSLLRYGNRRTLEQKRKVARDLHPEVRQMLRQGQLPGTHGRVLIRVAREDQPVYARFATQQKMGSRDLRALVELMLGEPATDAQLAEAYAGMLTERRSRRESRAATTPVIVRQVAGAAVTSIVAPALKSVQVVKRRDLTPDELYLALQADLEQIRPYCTTAVVHRQQD